MSRVLLIDNFDSFTYNLAHGFAEAGADEVAVYRNDAIDLDEAERWKPSHLVISPGPGTPDQTGISAELIRRFRGRIPILGVCLGHQLIAQLYGGSVGSAPELVHGMAGDVVRTAPDPLLEGLPERFSAGRYHSLAAFEPLPSELVVTARSDDGTVMALRHATYAIHGVQFHPESVLTPEGPHLMAAFLDLEEVA
jgi:anthranilate synthase/aminodeoxychorismate synthase-like glutamine amidotransferase